MRLLAKPAVLSMVVAVLAAPASALASSQTWIVNDASGAAPNASPDGVCDAPGPLNCTLPEAVLEANAVGHTDTIHFNLPPATTIALQGPAGLTLNQPMTIDGCSGAAAVAPCVGIDGTLASTTFGVFANGTTITGLAIGNPHPEGIFAPGGLQGLVVRNSWFGLTINGVADGGSAGLDLRGTGATIGGTAPGDRNVFANNAGGIRILGGTNNQVVGNYFGVAPDGVTAAPTSTSAAITIDANGMTLATGNVIGGNTAAEENLISNSTFAGPPSAPAIRINGQGDDMNMVLRNRGTGNAGPFVDVTPPDGLGNNPMTGADAGIQAPSIQAAAGLLFGAARPGAAVRVYQGNGNAGDLIGFIGVGLADGSGAWSLPCPSAGCPNEPSTATPVTANQTDGGGNSSELSAQVAYVHSVAQQPAQGQAQAPTGERAAALKKCKNKRSARARKRCRRRANALPV